MTALLLHSPRGCHGTELRDSLLVPSAQPSRRHALGLLAGLPVALAGLALTGCGNMKMEPKRKPAKSTITGRGGGPGGGIR